MAPEKLHTFSIGCVGSPDLAAARVVAEHIGSVHHEIVVTLEEMLRELPHVVRAIQSYDVTTVRASVPQYMVCRAASAAGFSIVFNGDCSEEIFGSYAYCKNAPTLREFGQDNVRLIEEVHMYDVLRSDRCTAHFGMDARTPFADKDLVQYVMCEVHPYYKHWGGVGGEETNIIEKAMLRHCAQSVLPVSVVSRPKEAFSDGVTENGGESWHLVVAKHFDSLIPIPEDYNVFCERQKARGEMHTKEAFFYYMICKEHVGPLIEDVVPQYWMPRFVKGAQDPSARELQKFSKDK